MKTLFVILLFIVSGQADACPASFARKSVFFKDWPEPLTVSTAASASIVARITVTEAKNGASVTGLARVDEVIKGSLSENMVRFVVTDRTSCGAHVWVGNTGIVLGNMTPNGALSLISATNMQIHPELFPR